MAVLRCTDPFAFTDRKTGVERVVRAGDLVDDNDPLVKGREQWFETVEANVHRVTERRLGRPRGSKNKPKPEEPVVEPVAVSEPVDG